MAAATAEVVAPTQAAGEVSTAEVEAEASAAAARAGLAAEAVARLVEDRIAPADLRLRGHLAAAPRIVAAPVATDMAVDARTVARPIAGARMAGLTEEGDRPTQAGVAYRTAPRGRRTLAARLRTGSGILSGARAAAQLRALERAGEASQIAAVRVQAVEFATQALRSPMVNGIPLAAAAAANPQGDPTRRVLRDVPLRVLRRFPARGPAVLWQDAPALA